jgi:hypothetical protein
VIRILDEGISREGATIDNDPLASLPLDVAGTAAPAELPTPGDARGIVTPCD